MSLTDSFFVYPLGSRAGTFSYEEQLPSLPLQSLDKTLSNYYDSLLPLATESELQSVRNVIDSFRNGIGKELDGMLQERAKREKNWLHEWWDKYAYLSGRYPLIPFCNMFGHSALDDFYKANSEIALKITTVDIYHLIEFWRLLRTERLKTVQGAEPSLIFSSAQFRRLFNTVRIPGEKFDSLLCYFQTEKEGKCPEHITIFRNGRIFKMDVNVNGKPITASQIECILRDIKNLCVDNAGQCVGYMTCDERTSWARNRNHLQAISEHNRNVLQSIEESMFVVSLDTDSPIDNSELCHLVMCANFESRWADKSFSIVYFENGLIAGMGDHTAYDGTISGTASLYAYSKIQEIGLDWYENEIIQKYCQPQELIFDIDEYIEKEIIRLKQDLQENKKAVDIRSEVFKDFGKSYLKEIKIHPDAFIQMALQLTYYKIHGKLCATYETATTRSYYNGRTETVRSCTLEALQWVKAMCKDREANMKKKELLMKATSKHNYLMREAKKNSGCDRHLFGLYCLVLDNNMEIPEFFTHELYNRSGGNGNFILSTSLSGYSPMGGAVAPMCLNGYGFFYNICTDEIRVYVTTYNNSKETDGRKFFKIFCETLIEMENLFPSSDEKSKL